MDKVAIFEELAKRNALRREAKLPLLDMRSEFDHECALARMREWDDFCATKKADIDRIRAEALAEYRAKHGPQFPSSFGGRLALQHAVQRRFEAFAAIHYGVHKPRFAGRNTITYGGG